MDADLERWKRWTAELSWRKVVWWPHRDLCRLGIDTLNLLCALGLPGTQKMDIGYCLRKIEQWAEKVKFYTDQMTHVFHRDPHRFGNSIGYFKALSLITCLQRDCGVGYNPATRDIDAPLTVADSFIHGIIQGNGGTCASLPVLYCAVGHHLGYPMLLMTTQGEEAGHTYGHNYIVWDDGEVRFNIEATGEGMGTPPDDHYRTGRYQMTPEIERRGFFLKPLNMQRSLALFLAERGRWCMDHQAYHHAIEAMAWAAALHPEKEPYLISAQMFANEWHRQLSAKKPPRFPEISIVEVERRRFASTLPFRFELDLCCIEAMECLLKNEEHEADLWRPLRRGETPPRLPVEAEVRVDKDGCKNIRFSFERAKNRDPGDFANV